MKKTMTKGEAQKRKLRRLSLIRETIQVLDEPELLGLARGGGATDLICVLDDDTGTYSHIPTICG